MRTHTSDAVSSKAADLELLDRYWRAANYLSVVQIYLLDNALLREPLRPRGDLDVIYVCGPGHGGPGMVANTYLEGIYSEIYPDIGRDADGLRKLFRQFSKPCRTGNARFDP